MSKSSLFHLEFSCIILCQDFSCSFFLVLFFLPSVTHFHSSTNHSVFFFLSAFPFRGSKQQIICLHLTPSSASSSLTPTNFMSSFTTSINLLFGLPLGLLSGSSNLIILLLIYIHYPSSVHVKPSQSGLLLSLQNI